MSIDCMILSPIGQTSQPGGWYLCDHCKLRFGRFHHCHRNTHRHWGPQYVCIYTIQIILGSFAARPVYVPWRLLSHQETRGGATSAVQAEWLASQVWWFDFEVLVVLQQMIQPKKSIIFTWISNNIRRKPFQTASILRQPHRGSARQRLGGVGNQCQPLVQNSEARHEENVQSPDGHESFRKQKLDQND